MVIKLFIHKGTLIPFLERDKMQPTWQNVIETTRQMIDARIAYWLNENLFTFGWWVLLVTTLGFLIVWVIILDKKRVFEIITYGLIVEVIAIVADTLGIFLSLWDYSNSVISALPLNTQLTFY